MRYSDPSDKLMEGCPSEGALKAARFIYWGWDWPGGMTNFPDDVEEIIDMARVIDKFTKPSLKYEETVIVSGQSS